MSLNPEHLQALADRIDTGSENPEGSRALVIFNLTETPQSGTAVFRASMSWPLNLPLPPVAVAALEGGLVAAVIRELSEAPDRKGRADRVLLSFALHLAATDIPANGWRTYIASYAEAASPLLENAAENADLIVIETTRHGGELPPRGNF